MQINKAILTGVLMLGLSFAAMAQTSPASTASPNIIVIMTDDLDSRLKTLDYTPKIRSLLTDQGTTFSNNFVNVSLCCPSRASFLRGQYVHNHDVLTNTPPTGGFEKAFATNIEGATVATALQSSGYHTGFIGKYLNGYPNTAPDTYIPPGWKEWYGGVGNAGYRGFNYTLNENGILVPYGNAPEDYLVDVMTRKAVDFIQREATPDNTPFFLYVAPFVPHTPATPAPRYANLFPGVKAPRLPSFNEADVSDKPDFIQAKPLLGDLQIAQVDALYRRRLQSMQAVDDLVEGIVATLKATGQLDNTYIFFTSDNGYHLGQHRLLQGKYLAYEEDINVPLIVRGPNIPVGKTSELFTSMIDLAPTFADLAKTTLPVASDGRSLVSLMQGHAPSDWRSAVLVEQYPIRSRTTGTASDAATGVEPYETGDDNVIGDTAFYFGLRTNRYKYVEYSNLPAIGEKELYDLKLDPFELNNLAKTASPSLLRQLGTQLQALKSCAGETCRQADK